MSEHRSIIQLLSEAMNTVKPVGKNSRNTEQNYNFRGIDAVVNASSPIFQQLGIVVVPKVLEASYRDVTTSRGKPSREVTVKVRYTFYGPAGDSVEAEVPGESMDTGDKGTAKAMSVALRIALIQILCLPTDEPDPDSFSPERGYRDEAAPAHPTGPTPEQRKAFDLAAKEIAACDTVEQLRRLWPDIVKRNETGVIHNDHCQALIEARDEAALRIQAEAGVAA